MTTTDVRIPTAHPKQRAFIDSPAKRKIIRAGRRGGKTVGVAILAVRRFLQGRRVLYAAPTAGQLNAFWFEIKKALEDPVAQKILYKHETEHYIELRGTKQRLTAKTAWNADGFRGDYADDLILDEFQLMHEDTWDRAGAPMLMDNDGDAVFIYTPPSLKTSGMSKADDPRHASKRFKLYARLALEEPERYATFHFSSHENPFLPRQAVINMAQDITTLAYRQEIEAQDIDEVPGALWTMAILESSRVHFLPTMHRIVVGVDPQATVGQTGIIVVGIAWLGRTLHAFVMADYTTPPGVKPHVWGQAAVDAYYEHQADIIVGEINNGGDMIENVIQNVAGGMDANYDTVHASRGKLTRAEPFAALFHTDENRKKVARCHLGGTFPYLEDELISWVPGAKSPNRLDAMVWALKEALGKTSVGYRIERNSVSLYGSRQTQASRPLRPGSRSGRGGRNGSNRG